MIALLRVTKAKLNVLDTFLKPIAASALMGGAAWGVQKLLSGMAFFQGPVMSRLATLLAVFVAIAVYALFTLLFAMFTKEELAYIPGGRKLARIARR
jgi:stage V sporulation protein B